MITLNGLIASAVKLWMPWQGAWTAEVDLTLAAVPVLPKGPAILVIGTNTLVGTIDDDATGTLGPTARARVIGGGGGWHKEVPARHFHNDAGLLSPAVISVTAAEVKEAAVVALPMPLGVDYMRTAGPASRVLADLDWFVTLAGITTVGPRLPIPANPLTTEITNWDAFSRRAEIASNDIIQPGTLLIDPRFGTATVRDVEQVFNEGGGTATAYCAADAGSKLSGLFRSLVKEHGQTTNLAVYHYRVVAQGPDGRLTLQAISRTTGVPDSLALPDWYGVPGLKASLVTPGSECAVVFLDGDPAKPAVIAYKGGDTLATGVATQTSQAAFVAALVAFVAAAQAFFNFPGIAALSGGTAQPAAAAAAALATTAVLPTNYSLRTKAS